MILVRALVVAAGGTLGVAARIALTMIMPTIVGVPIGILIANVLGAFLIGIVAARLGTSTLRLFLATGILGGFTTYSTYTVGTVELWQQSPILAIGYAVLSLVLGLAAVIAGLRVGRRRTVAAR